MPILKTKVRLSLHDQGRPMSLKRFEFAEVQDGHIYELARGIVIVSDVPAFSHMRQVSTIRRRLMRYQDNHPDRIYEILGTMECKLLVWDFESERHPDLAIYCAPPPIKRRRELWRRWLPEVALEVVSPRSVDRDYMEKREEYWTLGIKEYWIVDAGCERILVLRRGRNQWIQKELKRGDTLETKLLPGFKLACDEIFDAAGEQEDDAD
jgi:hypothetical protein